MQRFRSVIFNSCFAINCLLLFLLVFESRLVLPSWLQVVGRMHPLLLHFPITLLLLYITWSLFFEKKKPSTDALGIFCNWLLLLSAFTSSLTALMGFLLSKEDGYEAVPIQWHKWAGISIALVTSCWYAYSERIKKIIWLKITFALGSLIIVVFTGHLGAGITHGQNFLLSPINREIKQPRILMEEAEVFTHMVKPILQNKCMSCHSSNKAKGGLVMETKELLLKGGKNGKLWDTAAADYGLLLNRVHLPLETKKHMPPAGKPQLTEQEIQILHSWIKSGASFTNKVMELASADTLRKIAENLFNTIETDTYDFAAADEKLIKKLNTNYRVVSPLAKGSPALSVEFYDRQFYSPEQLKELLSIKDQVVSLNLNKMPVKDEELQIISQLKNLRKLNLSFSSITGSTLSELTKLKELKLLSLSGTKMKEDNVLKLSSLQKLSRLYAWNTTLQTETLEKLKQSRKGLSIESGFTGDTTVLKLNPPVAQNEEQVFINPVTLKLKHFINGVSIRYTLDGTEPDSIHAPPYSNNIVLNGNTTVKAKAFKPGWISSDAMEIHFYRSKYRPDSVVNLLPPDEHYKGDGVKTLTDLSKGEANNFKDGKWLGFRNNNMESMLLFNSPVTASSVTLSTLIDIGSSIMPPVIIEIWGGSEQGKLKLLHRIRPKQPTSVQGAYLKGFELSFPTVAVKCLKIVAAPVAKMPAWHNRKSEKGWVFVDEVVVN